MKTKRITDSVTPWDYSIDNIQFIDKSISPKNKKLTRNSVTEPNLPNGDKIKLNKIRRLKFKEYRFQAPSPEEIHQNSIKKNDLQTIIRNKLKSNYPLSEIKKIKRDSEKKLISNSISNKNLRVVSSRDINSHLFKNSQNKSQLSNSSFKQHCYDGIIKKCYINSVKFNPFPNIQLKKSPRKNKNSQKVQKHILDRLLSRFQ